MAQPSVTRLMLALDRRLRRVAAVAVNRVDARLARRIEANAPVRTGELRSKIDVLPARQTPRGVAGGVVIADEAAAPTEFGTADESPRPFIRPSIAAEIGAMRRDVEQTFRESL